MLNFKLNIIKRNIFIYMYIIYIKMQTVECATFHLNVGDISPNVSSLTQFGSVNQYRNDFTWNNINFQTILGTMFDKYDSFNIKLSLICHNNIAAQSANNQNLMLKVNMSGLPFQNCTYHSSVNSNMGICTMGAFALPSYPSGVYFNDDNVFSIYKPPAIASIRIYLTTVDDYVPNWAQSGPIMDFYFRVYGIKNT